MSNPVKLTPQHLKELQDEMVWMKTVREKEVADLIKEARSFGDLSENSEYDEAKDQQGKLYSREAEVQAILDNYVLIDESTMDDTSVAVGGSVKVLDEEFDEELEFRIVGTQEADSMDGRISEESPFGKALLGKRVGDSVKVHAPAGEFTYRILEISNS
ncbi:MAG: transcription elongation factor GreA [Clostridiales bacterium]|nr:transcription elongation factor GreA [Clostridiales bacterium]MCD8161561.1 transcription elongation factor GreA [Clostridiales bacterium]